MDLFLTSAEKGKLTKSAKQRQEIQEEASKAASSNQKMADLAYEEYVTKIEAYQRAKQQISNLDKGISSAKQKGGAFMVTISVHPSDADEAIELKLPLSNLDLGSDSGLLSQRDQVHVITVGLLRQLVTKAEALLNQNSPVEVSRYRQAKFAQ